MSPRRSNLRAMAVLLAGSILIVFAIPALAAAGDPDATFRGDGSTTTEFRNAYGVATGVAVQADARIVVAGYMFDATAFGSDYALVRYRRHGQLDPSFSGNGKLRTDFGDRFDAAHALTIQPDGRIVVAGTSSDDFSVARYDSDGSLDPSFSHNGKRVIDVGGFGGANAVAVSSGKIVLAGTDASDFVVVRFNANGSLDRTFGGGGIVRTAFYGGNSVARAIAIQEDGKIVVGGSAFFSDATRPDFALARYETDGTLDESFGSGGLVTTDFLNWEDGITGLALDADGNIVASGQASQFPGTADQNSDVGLARYLPDGSLDATFGDGGKVRTDFGSLFEQAEGMAIAADGKIVVGSPFLVLDPYANTQAVARYETDGSLDSSFGDGGIAVSDQSVTNDQSGGLALAPNGKIVTAAGTQTSTVGQIFGFAVCRFLAS